MFWGGVELKALTFEILLLISLFSRKKSNWNLNQMQLYVVTWKFESSEDQTFALEALIDYVKSGKSNETPEGYERIAWVHTPQDGTGIVLCKAASAAVLYKVFGPWREKFGMIWDYKPGLTTEDFVELLSTDDWNIYK